MSDIVQEQKLDQIANDCRNDMRNQEFGIDAKSRTVVALHSHGSESGKCHSLHGIHKLCTS